MLSCEGDEALGGGRVVTGGLRKGGTVDKTGQADSGASFYRAENSHTAVSS